MTYENIVVMRLLHLDQFLDHGVFSLRRIEDWMGLDGVRLIMDVEAKFGFDISDADAGIIRSVGDLHAYILSHAQPPPDAEAAWTWLVDTLEEEFGVPRKRIVPEAWIVRDLGIE